MCQECGKRAKTKLPSNEDTGPCYSASCYKVMNVYDLELLCFLLIFTQGDERKCCSFPFLYSVVYLPYYDRLRQAITDHQSRYHLAEEKGGAAKAHCPCPSEEIGSVQTVSSEDEKAVYMASHSQTHKAA